MLQELFKDSPIHNGIFGSLKEKIYGKDMVFRKGRILTKMLKSLHHFPELNICQIVLCY